MSRAIDVERTERIGNLVVEVTYNLDSRQRAVQVTRQKKGGRVSAMTFFPDGELDDLIEALNDAADHIEGVDSDQRLSPPKVASAPARKSPAMAVARGR